MGIFGSGKVFWGEFSAPGISCGNFLLQEILAPKKKIFLEILATEIFLGISGSRILGFEKLLTVNTVKKNSFTKCATDELHFLYLF